MVDLSMIMKKAQEMQSKMQDMQAKLDTVEIDGASGGGMVKVTINGKGNMKKISFDDSVVTTEDKEMLEDLTVAAFNDAKEKLEKKLEEEMKDEMGSLGLPAGFPPLF
jgi:DNA-binding YbaB/EbfC family protein